MFTVYWAAIPEQACLNTETGVIMQLSRQAYVHTGNTKLHISNNTCSTSLQHTVLQSTLHSIQIRAGGVLCRDMEDLCLYVPIRTRIYRTAHVSSEGYITIVLYTLDIDKMAAYSTRIYPTAHVSSEGYITFATSTTSLT